LTAVIPQDCQKIKPKERKNRFVESGVKHHKAKPFI
jgi:hypothetical protein